MVMTDPIADMLTRIRNAIQRRHPRVEVPASKMKIEIARILKDRGFIEDYTVQEVGRNKKVLELQLRYRGEDTPVIEGLERVSKPGLRIYVSKDEIPVVRGGTGIVILSTSRGILTGKEARRLGVGGEVLCKVW